MGERSGVEFRSSKATPGLELMLGRNVSYAWREVTKDYEIARISRGGAEWAVGSRRYHAREGSVLVVLPGEIHFAIGEPRASDFVALLVPRALVDEMCPESAPLRPRDHQLDEPETSAAVAELHASVEADDDPVWIETALADVLARVRSDAPRPPGGIPRRIVDLRRALEERHRKRLSLGELAEAAGLTKVQTVREFTRAYGVTPFAYLTSVRMANARELLAEGEDVTRAAHATGFADASHLHRWFRRAYLVAPSAYARAVATTPAP